MTALDPQMNGAPPSPEMGLAPVMAVVGLEEAQMALLRAIKICGELAGGQDSAAESKDYAAAAKALADAYVVLDPAVDGTGVPLDHQLGLEATRQEGQLRLEEARARQAGPAQTRREVKIKRDQYGRTESIGMEEG